MQERLKMSEVVWKVPMWRRLLLFQSSAQMLSWLCFLVLCLLCVQGLYLAFAHQAMPVHVCVAACLGTLPSLYAALPCVFVMDAGHWVRVAPGFPEAVRVYGDVPASGDPDGAPLVYRHRLPRWARWEENAILIVPSHGGSVTVQAPKAVAGKLRARLLRMLA